MMMFIEVFNLFNNSNEVDFFVITLNEGKNIFFDREFNVFFNVDFLNWSEFCANDVNRSNESTNSIKMRLEVKRKSNKFFERNVNVLKASKWLQRLNSKIKQFNYMFSKTLWTFIQNLFKIKWWLFNFVINMSVNVSR